jgi:hypothetical protein
MTDEELERQAKLWHVESALSAEKTEQVQEQLDPMALRAQVLQKSKRIGIIGSALAGVGILGALGLGILPLFPRAKIERLEPYPGDITLYAPVGLALNGAIVGSSSDMKNMEGMKNIIWHPDKTKPNLITHNPLASYESIQNITRDGTPITVQTISEKPYKSRIVLKKEKEVYLKPLTGYINSHIIVSMSTHLLGNSYKKNFSQPTLWHNEKPEELIPGNKTSYRLEDGNEGGEFLLQNGNISDNPNYYSQESVFAVYRNKKLIHLKPVVRIGSSLVTMSCKALSIGKDGMVVGIATKKENVIGIVWPAGKEEAIPIWNKKSPIDFKPIACNDVDEKGRVVGEMITDFTAEHLIESLNNTVTERPTAFLWKDGRYIDLQKLLPPGSGWRLRSAKKICGRYILGKGEYQGQGRYIPIAQFRMTLPPELE